MVSMPVPGVKGTMILMVWLGYGAAVWACGMPMSKRAVKPVSHWRPVRSEVNVMKVSRCSFS
jgi:hypothetical protein